MGCDIHVFVEELDKDNTWEAVEHPDIGPEVTDWIDRHTFYVDRDYPLFGTLCMGVRNRAYSFSLPRRGFPPVMSKIFEKFVKAWGTDAHSESFIYRDELEKLSGRLLLLGDNDALGIRPGLNSLIATLPPPRTTPDKQRIVFFFDN